MSANELSPRLLRVQDAAKYLGSTVHFIRSQVWLDQLPHLRLGKRILIDRADLDTLIERQKNRPLA